MKQANNDLRTNLGLTIAAIVLVGIAAASFYTVNRLADDARWVDHTQRVIRELETLTTQISLAESGQRGFLLTDEARHLKLYQESSSAIPAVLDSLQKLTADNPLQQRRIANLSIVMDRRLAMLRIGIESRQRGEIDAFAERARLDDGRELMEELVAQVGDMRGEEDVLLKQRSVVLEAGRIRTNAFIVLGNLGALGLLLFSFGVMRGQIAQRRLAEIDVRRYADDVEDLYNNAPCGYHSLNAQGVFVQVNDTELRWLGYERRDLIGKVAFADLLLPNSRLSFQQNFSQVKQGASVNDVEYELIRKDGSVLPVSLNAIAMHDDVGNFTQSRASLFDVTLRREAEQRMHRANAFLDSVFEHIPHMIFVKDAAELRFVRFNKAGERLLGLPKGAIIGKSDYDFFTREQADAFVAKDREVLATGKLVDIVEEPIHSRVLGDRWLHTKKIPIADEAGNPRYLLGISEDVTDAKASERRIVELNQALESHAAELQASNHELESFSYSVSHDLRSPLRAIDGFSRILEEDYGSVLDSEGRRLLGVIRSNTKRMGQLIDDLLAFSRIGRQHLNMATVDMAALAQEALTEVQPEYEKLAP
ncbi:MAG: CHASE3 domain-containing protein, partial [Betaproteobacteria bacterium]